MTMDAYNCKLPPIQHQRSPIPSPNPAYPTLPFPSSLKPLNLQPCTLRPEPQSITQYPQCGTLTLYKRSNLESNQIAESRSSARHLPYPNSPYQDTTLDMPGWTPSLESAFSKGINSTAAVSSYAVD